MNSSHNENKSECMEMKRRKEAWRDVQKRKRGGGNNTGTDLNKYIHMGNVIIYVLIFSDPV